jgi:GTP cyclohydrolase I
MNKDQFESVMRTILKAVGASLVTAGQVQTPEMQANMETVIGAAVFLAGLLWSQFNHK